MEIGKAKSQQLVQTVYFGLSLGGIIDPILAQPFLSKMYLVRGPIISNNSQNLLPTTFLDKFKTFQLNETAMGQGYYYITPTKVMYFYLIIGCFLLLPSFTFLCLYLTERKQHDYEYCAAAAAPDEDDNDDNDEVVNNGNHKPLSTEPIQWSCPIVAEFGMLMLFSPVVLQCPR